MKKFFRERAQRASGVKSQGQLGKNQPCRESQHPKQHQLAAWGTRSRIERGWTRGACHGRGSGCGQDQNIGKQQAALIKHNSR